MFSRREFARILDVSPKTVTSWSRSSSITCVRTPGGHRRYPLAAVIAFLEDMGFDEQTALDMVRRRQVKPSSLSTRQSWNTTPATE
jgi:DNA-binding transcriptional MerR regulator